jgi:hypothetical protein
MLRRSSKPLLGAPKPATSPQPIVPAKRSAPTQSSDIEIHDDSSNRFVIWGSAKSTSRDQNPNWVHTPDANCQKERPNQSHLPPSWRLFRKARTGQHPADHAYQISAFLPIVIFGYSFE